MYIIYIFNIITYKFNIYTYIYIYIYIYIKYILERLKLLFVNKSATQ